MTRFRFSPFLLLSVLLVLGHFHRVKGQQNVVPVPDCIVFVNQTLTAGSAATINVPSTNGFDNRTAACVSWTFQYQANATSGTFTSIAFQAANGSSTPGTFANWSGTVSSGINPNTNQNNAISTFNTGCTSGMACTTPNSWVKLVITRNNFVGTINGVLYGYKSGTQLNVTVTPSGTQNVNLVQVGSNTVVTGGVNGSQGVGGLAADGADQAGNPVLVAGHDNDAPTPNVRTLQLDTFGQMLLSSSAVAQADGTSNTPNVPTMGVSGTAAPSTFRVFQFKFNGSTWDRVFACTNRAAVTLSGATDAVMVAGVANTNIRVCHFSFSNGGQTADITIRQGTGSTCGTNTLDLTGAYASVTGLALDFTPDAALRTTVTGRDLCIHTTPSITGGGVIIYAQY